MKRRVILIVTIVTVVAGLAAGVYWYTHRHSGTNYLERADVAMKAKNYDKAGALAVRHIEAYPDDWQGYYYQARAFFGAGRYVDARKPLTDAHRRFPDRVSITIALADTYSRPAAGTLKPGPDAKSSELCRGAIKRFLQAQDILDAAYARIPSDKIATVDGGVRLLEQVGLNRMRLRKAQLILVGRLAEEAKVARAARTVDMVLMMKNLQAIASALVELDDSASEAAGSLLAVARIDASRDTAVTPLVQLCLGRADKSSHDHFLDIVAGFPAGFRKIIASTPAELHDAITSLSDVNAGAGAPEGAELRKALAAMPEKDRTIIAGLHDELREAIAGLKTTDQLHRIVLALSDKARKALAVSAAAFDATVAPLPEAHRKTIAAAPKRYRKLVASWLVIDELRRIIASAPDPAPIGTTNLLLADLVADRSKVDAKTMLLKLAGAGKRLDDILSRHPDVIDVRLARANVALDSKDASTARVHCDTLRKVETRNPRVRLLHAMLLRIEGLPKQAKEELYRLTTDFPGWIPGQLALARQAYLAGESSRAKDAMLVITKLSPGHPEASRFVARYLQGQGHYEDAFTDASAYYKAYPDHPEAVKLCVASAFKTNRPKMAREILAQARADHGDDLGMMVVVAGGYQVLGDNAEAMAVAGQIAKAKPASAGERVAVARAMLVVGRRDEAEKLLGDELKRDPGQAEVAFELGGLYASLGRVLPALKCYRAAVVHKPLDEGYRTVLARMLLENGDLVECEETLERVTGENLAGNLVRLQLNLLRGQPVDVQEMIQRVGKGTRSGLPLAISYLSYGKPEQCITMCLAELKKRPGDMKVRSILGQAHLVLGQTGLAVDQWTRVLASSPQNLSAYMRLAAVLSRKQAPEQVRYYLSHIPVSEEGLVDMTMGWLLAARGDYARAAAQYGLVASRPNTGGFHRGQAILLGARALAMSGQAERAVIVLDKLVPLKDWRSRALLIKAQVLVSAKQNDRADKTLAELMKLAVADQDVTALRGIVALRTRLRKIPAALGACQEIRRIVPRGSRPYVLTGDVYIAGGDLDSAITWYRKAIEIQSGDRRAYLALAKVLEAVGGPASALPVLVDLEKLGGDSATIGIFEQGAMFTRWGLHAEAIKCFERLSTGGRGQGSRTQLLLGSAFARLGDRDRATKLLSKVSSYSTQYVSAQRLLAELTEDVDKRLEILKALVELDPGGHAVPIQEMSALMRSERVDEAIELFERTFVGASVESSSRTSTAAATLAMRAMLRKGDTTAAGDLSLRMYKQSTLPAWRLFAILLTVKDRPAVAAGLLGQGDRGGTLDVLAGLVVAGRQGDGAAVKKYRAGLDAIDRKLSSRPSGRGVSVEYKILAALAAGDAAGARKALSGLKSGGILMRKAAAELMASSAGDGAPAEAAALLKASLAAEMGLTAQGSAWAMETLTARPTCQWAATIAFLRAEDPKTCDRIMKTLKPADCLIARAIRAWLCMHQRKYPQAAELYAQLAADKDGGEFVIPHAQAVEKAGKIPEALELYRKIWLSRKDVGAANNVAYLTAEMYPNDTGKLTEVYNSTKTLLTKYPRSAILRDTLGWIAHLLGKRDEAVQNLRLAVRLMPGVPEVHYHLGAAQAGAKQNEAARWHLSAAVNIGQTMKTRKQHIAPETAKAIQLAKAALERLP